MCHRFVRDARIWTLLLGIDRDLADSGRRSPCPHCGSVVHRANYPRKPRGAPDGLSPEFSLRLSNCCSAEDCRRRVPPPSVRFLGRRVYLGVVVALITALRQGPTPSAARTLSSELGADRRTIERWRIWWTEVFPSTRFWRAARARFMPVVDERALPASLLDRFDRPDPVHRFRQLMVFLSPMSSGHVF